MYVDLLHIFYKGLILKLDKTLDIELNYLFKYKDIINTFEKKDVNRFIKPENIAIQAPQGSGQMEAPAPWQNPNAALTESVAKGGITSGIV